MGADATKRAAREFRRYAERTRDRGGFGGGEYATLSTSGSLPGSSIRSVTGWISATPAGNGACSVVDTQSAINGHWSQSTGADFSEQHGMSSDMDAASSAMEAMAIEAAESTFARAASGANTRPAIKKIASSRQRWIERFTKLVSHNPAHDGKRSSITKPRVSLKYPGRERSHCDESNPSAPAGPSSYCRSQNIFLGRDLR